MASWVCSGQVLVERAEWEKGDWIRTMRMGCVLFDETKGPAASLDWTKLSSSGMTVCVAKVCWGQRGRRQRTRHSPSRQQQTSSVGTQYWRLLGFGAIYFAAQVLGACTIQQCVFRWCHCDRALAWSNRRWSCWWETLTLTVEYCCCCPCCPCCPCCCCCS